MKNYKDDFLNYLQTTKNYAFNTIKTYDIAISEMFEYTKLEQKDTDKFVLDLTLYRKSLYNQSSATIAKKLSSIRSFVEFLRLGGLSISLIANDSVQVKKEHFTPISSTIIKNALNYATVEEKLLIYLTYNYGLKISEISNLKLSDIDNNMLFINGANARKIPLEMSFLKLLGIFLSQFDRNCYLFEKNEKRLSENSLRYTLVKCFKKIDVKITPQQLRYSLIADMLKEGAKVDDIQKLLGHKSLSMVLPKVEFSKTKKIKTYKIIHPMCKDDNGNFN